MSRRVGDKSDPVSQQTSDLETTVTVYNAQTKTLVSYRALAACLLKAVSGPLSQQAAFLFLDSERRCYNMVRPLPPTQTIRLCVNEDAFGLQALVPLSVESSEGGCVELADSLKASGRGILPAVMPAIEHACNAAVSTLSAAAYVHQCHDKLCIVSRAGQFSTVSLLDSAQMLATPCLSLPLASSGASACSVLGCGLFQHDPSTDALSFVVLTDHGSLLCLGSTLSSPISA